jgi:urea transporter
MSSTLNDFQPASRSEPRPPARARLRSLLRSPGQWSRATLSAYAGVWFSQSPWAGAFFLLATLLSPAHGLAGLLGLGLTVGWARLFGRPEAEIEGGLHGINGLLVGLAVGAQVSFGPALVGLLVLAALLCALLGGTLANLFQRYLGVPVLCLPFVLVAWTTTLAGRRFMLPPNTDPLVQATLDPGLAEAYLRSLGAVLFQTSPIAGALVLIGLVLGSRWVAIQSALGFAAGWSVYVGLGGAASEMCAQLIGFNCILTAVAVGGIFVLLSPASILLATAAAGLAAVLSAAMSALLESHGLPALAMPFVLCTQLTIFALLIRTRTSPRGPRLVRGAIATPEVNLARAVHHARRYPDPAVPSVYSPVVGPWLITQGPHGEHTHQGLWAHAWDFEVDDDEGKTWSGEGDAASDYYAFGKPVLSPGDGQVVRVIDHLPDNPVGEVDTDSNWGNLVIVAHAGGVFSALCHLQQASVLVREGDIVFKGRQLAAVGNSGRSPYPHLHLQLQRSAEVGAPTVFGQLLHYTSSREDYMTCGVPRTGDHITALAPEDNIRRALTLAPGLTWDWVVDRNGQSQREAWRSVIDPLGTRRLESGTDQAAIFADDRYVTVLDYHGRADSLLGLLSLGLPRAPFGSSGLVWSDTPAATPFVGPIRRLLHELALPFAEVGTVDTRSQLEVTGPGTVRVTTTLKGSSCPDRIEITCVAGQGPVLIAAFVNNQQTLHAECVG